MDRDRHYSSAVVHFTPGCDFRTEPYSGGIYLMPGGWVDLIDDDVIVPIHNVAGIEYAPDSTVRNKLDDL